MIFNQTSFEDLYKRSYIKSDTISSNLNSGEDRKFYCDESGYHLYTQLSLTLKYTAPQNKNDAEKAFEIIQRYSDIVDNCTNSYGGRILEVQGERIHLFFRKDLDRESASSMLAFCSALTTAVYNQRSFLGKEDFQGFKSAFDHGRTIMIITGTNCEDSIISLGPCANYPAKRLSSIKAEYTSMPFKIAKLLFNDLDERRNWHDIRVRMHDNGGKLPSIYENNNMFDEQAIRATSRIYGQSNFTVDLSPINANQTFKYAQSKLIRGFCMRADLHDFTAKVQNSFDSDSEHKIKELLDDFNNILMYGNAFLEKAKRPNILLPWAGDCANILLFPKTTETIDDAKCYYSAKGPADWLTGYNGLLEKPFKDAKWVVSICSGGQDEGSGYILLAKVHTSSRDFLFSVGWCVGRSQDAQEISDVKADDALTSKSDYRELEDDYQELFHEADSNFMKSGKLVHSPECIYPKNVPPLGSAPTSHSASCVSVPNPRPYYIFDKND